MRNTKKAISILLTLLMVVGMMSTFAFAAGENEAATTTKGSIIISADTVQDGKTYTPYKIFDVTYNKTTGNYAYTMVKQSPWETVVRNYFILTDNGSVYSVKEKDGYSAAAFANALNEALNGETPTVTTAQAAVTAQTGNKGIAITFSNLALGYYFVTSGQGTVCNLTTTNPTVTIHDKNDKPFIEKVAKEDDKNITSADIGKVIPYTITGKVPSLTGYTSYTYKVEDTMTGSTLNANSITVKFGDTTYSPSNTELTTTNKSFTLNLNLLSGRLKTIATAGTKIIITYSATVDESAITTGSATNNAILTYSNDPNSQGTGKTTPVIVTVKTFDINIDKVDSENAKLPGAKFVLKNSENKFYNVDKDKKVTWKDNQNDATVVTTDDKGAASFDGIAVGTYYLMETEAPEGYNILKESIKVVITDNGAVTIGEGEDSRATSATDKGDITVDVINYTGSELPSTGGIGTTIFYLIGAILVIGAGVVFVTRRRMHSDK